MKDPTAYSDGAMTLDDACEFIVDCLHKTAPIQSTGYPSIRTPNVGRGRLILDGVNRVSEEVYEEWTKRAVPRPGDLILAREAPAGNVAVIKDGQTVCLGQRTVHLRPNRETVDSDFLCYYLLTPRRQGLLLAGETGATTGHVNMRDIRRLDIGPLPSLDTQKTIGQILAAYDDLIENNRQRIALLEAAARLLYREWFVHFRFPGHEHIRIVNGIPEGWKMSNASAVMEVLSGGTPKTSNPAFWGGDIGFFTPKDVTDTPFVLETEKTITEEGLRACNSKLYPSNTVFITARGTVGKLNMALVPMAMNQSCYALRSKTYLGQRHLFLALKSAIEQVRARATGSVFDAIIVATFTNIPFVLPPKKLTDIFARHIEPNFDQIANLVQQCEKLAQARDLLLPRLMNGEIAG